MALVELRNISLTYHSRDGETEAIKDVSLSIEDKEFVAIVGPSGSGKTTLLKIMAGLIAPSGGEIIKAESTRVAYMPQRDGLFEWRSVMKNVLLAPEIAGGDIKKARAYAEELLEKYGLKEFSSKRPSELSGGMRQRAALIRTLVTKPKLMLLDEPFSALDFQTRLYVCDDVLRIIKAEEKTAVLVTHDINEAVSMADRVIVLTARPAGVKSEYTIGLDKSLPPLKRRELKNFSVYFKNIWMDMEAPNE